MVAKRQLCTFWVAQYAFAVDVADVQSVVANQPMTRVPLAPPGVRGLMNLRGAVIAVIDLRPCLGLDDQPAGDAWTNIILKGAWGPVSLVVDGIGDVAEVDDDEFDQPPETLPGRLREITHSVCQKNGQLTLVLNVERSIQLASGVETEY